MSNGATISAAQLHDADDARLREMHALAVVAHSTALYIWELSLRLGADCDLVLHADGTANAWRGHLEAIVTELQARGLLPGPTPVP